MAKNMLGIEIGNYRLKLTVGSNGEIVQNVIEEMPDDMVRDGEILSWEGMTDFLRETLKKHRISTRNAAVVIPPESTYLRRIDMPMMSEAQLKINLPYEFHDFITEDKDRYFYDYAVLPEYDSPLSEESRETEESQEAEEPRQLHLLGAAVPKELIERYRTMLRKCSLKLRLAVPETVVYQNMIWKHLDDLGITSPPDYAILDLGQQTSRLHMFIKGNYDVTNSMDLGMGDLTQIIAEKLSVDRHIAEIHKQTNQNHIQECEECRDFYSDLAVRLMRAVNFFTFNQPDNALDCIYCCGGGCGIAPLMEELRNTVELRVEGLDRLFDEVPGVQEQILQCPTSVGITWTLGGK